MNFEIQSIKNVYEIQYVYDKYNYITINTKKLKYTGTLRYAFKYAIWALKVGGEIEIIDEPFRDFGFSTKRIDFWQIKHSFFKSMKDNIEILDLDDKKGYIRVKKIKESYINNGFSFGIVFSGSENEKEQLTKSIQSILSNIDLNKFDYEVIICGPSSFDSESYLNFFKSFNVKYLSFDFDLNVKRFMITQKKNYIYNNCKYNIISINHTRILYATDFMVRTFDKKFDVFTPKIMTLQDNKYYRYLDIGLISSYDLYRISKKFTISNILMNDNFYKYTKNRVPYIDGGLTIFNKNIIKNTPYNIYIAWGEAEDVEMCSRLNNEDYLIDLFDCYENKFLSQTNKLNFKLNFKFFIKKFLLKLGC